MPRCLMAKKWKAYPWPDRLDDPQQQQHDEQNCSVGIEQEQHINDNTNNNNNNNNSNEHDLQRTTSSNLVMEKKHHRHHHQHHQHHQHHHHEPEDEEIDVVGDTDNRQVDHQQTCWGPHSPTAGATAPSPPPLNASGALYYHGYTHESWIGHEEPPKYATLRSAAELAQPVIPSPPPQEIPPAVVSSDGASLQPASTPTVTSTTLSLLPRKSLSMCFTSTGTALSLPPKKKDIYRPYSLQPTTEIRTSAEEDLSAAQAILDLSASPAAPTHSVFIHTLSSPQPTQVQPNVATVVQLQQQQQQQQPTPTPPPPPPPPLPQQQPTQQLQRPPSPPHPIPVSVLVPVPTSQNGQLRQQEHAPPQPQSPATAEGNVSGNCNGRDGNSNGASKTVAYTYEAFFVSDGRSKRRGSNNGAVVPDKEAVQPDRPKFTCTECGKQYATSSNLSRHKQTHRSLDSQSAKKCIHCGKAYVSMPALAMHVLTHKLAHSCGVCGKMFSRPWLLQGHLRSHTGEKPYGCAHCGKAFADRSNLRAHMQTHSADKNYECSRCHKTFALKSYLNKHLESACLRDEDVQQQQHQQHQHCTNGPQQQQQQQQQQQSPNRGL